MARSRGARAQPSRRSNRTAPEEHAGRVAPAAIAAVVATRALCADTHRGILHGELVGTTPCRPHDTHAVAYKGCSGMCVSVGISQAHRAHGTARIGRTPLGTVAAVGCSVERTDGLSPHAGRTAPATCGQDTAVVLKVVALGTDQTRCAVCVAPTRPCASPANTGSACALGA